MTPPSNEIEKKDEELSLYAATAKKYPFLNNIIGGLVVLIIGGGYTYASYLYPFLIQFLPWILFTFASGLLGVSFYRNRKLNADYRNLLANSTLESENVKSENTKLLSENNELRESINNPKLLIETTIDSVTGLVTYYERLEDSPYHPKKCLPKIKNSLDFMGNGASKWTIRISEEILENALNQISQSNGKARFLILNPLDSESISNINDKRKIAKSLCRLKTIQEELLNKTILEIKVFNHIPQFRLTFIDSKILVIGHYGGKNRGDSNYSPLLEFSGDNTWSFYHAFSDYFERQWKNGDSPDWEEIKKIVSETNS